MKKQYLYPQNMRMQVRLWFWSLKDLVTLGIALALSVVCWAKFGLIPPAVGTVLYGFLTMRIDESSILDYIRRAWSYFLGSQQYFEWKEQKK